MLLMSFCVSAQVKGVVKDSISGMPIPYATIFIENMNICTIKHFNYDKNSCNTVEQQL